MKLSKEQYQAVTHLEGPALVLAVPGAGKTTVLIHRTINLVDNHNVQPNRILSITFSKSSANDMKKRYAYTSNENVQTPNFMTIHAFCYSIVRDYYKAIKRSLSLIEDEKTEINKYKIIQSLFQNINGYSINEEKMELFISNCGYIKNMLLDIEEFVKLKQPDVENFAILYKAYENYKKQKNLIDFDDMLTIAYEILLSNEKILQFYRNRFDYYQLDEGQDTSKIQFEILKLLAFPNNNLFVVADDDQSIYGFRGANPQGLLNFSNIFENSKLYYMVDNYRSSKNIVTASNSFIHLNKQRYDKTIKTRNPNIEPVEVIKLKDKWDQYEYIIKDILNRKNKSIAILYRNNLSAVGLIDYLDKNSINFNIRDIKLKLFNHWLLKDIICFLDFSSSPNDYESFLQIYYKTKGYISKNMMLWAGSNHLNLNIFQRLLRFPGISEFYKKQIKELELDFKRLNKLSVDKRINYILNDMAYDDYLKDNCIKFGNSYGNIKSMVYTLMIIGKDIKDLSVFKDRLVFLNSLIKSNNPNKFKLTLSTIHSAKGLEFDVVYIIDLIEGEFPSSAIDNNLNELDLNEIEEERRVFYVGMTRAKQHLKLLWYSNLNNEKTQPSMFIRELSTEKRP